MYQDSYGSYNSNPATDFLQNQMQSSFTGSVQQSGAFTNVMNSMTNGVSQNAAMGNLPTNNNMQNLTPQQVAAQMQVGGVMSTLPMLGGKAFGSLMFPIAGVWSLIDGVRTAHSMHNEINSEAAAYQRFDPSQMKYNQAVQQMDQVQTRYNYY